MQAKNVSFNLNAFNKKLHFMLFFQSKISVQVEIFYS